MLFLIDLFLSTAVGVTGELCWCFWDDWFDAILAKLFFQLVDVDVFMMQFSFQLLDVRSFRRGACS